MHRAAQNPFDEMGLTELAGAARALVRELSERKPRTREARADLVEQTVMLLSVLAREIEPQSFPPHSAEFCLAKGRSNIATHFLIWHIEEMNRAQRAVRRRTLARAANLVLGTKARLWLGSQYDAHYDHACHRAAESEEGLIVCLRELEVIARRQNGEEVPQKPEHLPPA